MKIKTLLAPLLVLCCLSVCACTSTGTKLVREQQRLRANILEQYRIKNDNYLEYLRQRFEIALRRSGKEIITPKIELLIPRSQDSQPFAFAINKNEVVISSALVSSIKNEAQLGFIIAHEIGHIALGHIENPARSSADRLKQESEADGFGLGLSALAGYDIRHAIGAVLLQPELFTTPQATYPDPQLRFRTLQQKVLTSAWKPPGTINRNDFLLFQQRLVRESVF